MITRPVRKIGKSQRSITGKHISRKTGTIHRFESALERDHLIILEFNDEVSHYVTQPLTIHYEHENDYLRYTPDVMVYYNDDLKIALQRPCLWNYQYNSNRLKFRKLS